MGYMMEDTPNSKKCASHQLLLSANQENLSSIVISMTSAILMDGAHSPKILTTFHTSVVAQTKKNKKLPLKFFRQSHSISQFRLWLYSSTIYKYDQHNTMPGTNSMTTIVKQTIINGLPSSVSDNNSVCLVHMIEIDVE
jgi:hypothetical protein